MADSLEDRCRRLVATLGLAEAADVRAVTALTGGVASDIAVVDLGHRQICAKFALAKLRVAEDWRAPIHRNSAEYWWLAFAGRTVAGAAPELYGHSAAENGFAMAYVTGADVVLWKDALLAGVAEAQVAGAVGDVLGRLHRASADAAFDRTGFDNRDDFRALRIEPYLLFTARRHARVAARLEALADRLYGAGTALVHGDVSPKNILLRDGKPMLLDAECASTGDPAFDVAFCLNHLVLKAVHLPGSRDDLLACAAALWRAYAGVADWEPADDLEARVAALVPALMLARVDGKSPVEYLSPTQQERVRDLALTMLADPPADLAGILSAIGDRTNDG